MKKRELIGYGAATVSDAAPYSFVTVYLILFLTTVAGLSPEIAGGISSAIILVNGLSEILLGYISDNTRSRYGRRRPYLLAAVAPLGVGLTMLFAVYPLGQTAQVVLYLFAGLLFWAGFGIYYTPYAALGAELTDDYDERSRLRTYARFFGILGNLLGMVLPLTIIQQLQNGGVSERNAWLIMALAVAVFSCGSILITWRSTRGKERPAEPSQKEGLLQIFRDYLAILRLKPFKYLLGVIAGFIIANSFYSSSMVFFARYRLGIEDEVTSGIFLVSIIANFVYMPFLGAASQKFGKKQVMVFCMAASGVGCILFWFIGIGSYLEMGIYACVFSFAYACFWQLFNSVLYDISEVGEYKIGKRMEGSILSVYGLAFSVSMSLATQLLGWILKFSGYSSELSVQPDSALSCIGAVFTLIPGVFLILAAVMQGFYPLNKARFDLLKLQLQRKKAGQESDTSGLERII